MPIAPYLETAPVLDTGVFIHDSAQVIGDVTLGRDSSVWCNAVLRGDVNRITVGVCSNVQDLTMGHVSTPPRFWTPAFLSTTLPRSSVTSPWAVTARCGATPCCAAM